MTKLEKLIREKLDELEKQHVYEISTDTIRAWLDNSKKAPAQNIEQRKSDFNIHIMGTYWQQYDPDMLDDFVQYWTEHNEGGTKMRFEMQKVFNIKRRLLTWAKRSQNYGKAKGTNKTGASGQGIANAAAQVFGKDK